MTTQRCLWLPIASLFFAASAISLFAAAPRLKVSNNKHFLICEDGKPFFYLGIPDPEFSAYHREVFAFLKLRARYEPNQR